ncbi:MAG: SDR family oxidoreductase [Clostridiales bacterium]|nr:SDR family oxidoreductase [Clostridiales bacterium]
MKKTALVTGGARGIGRAISKVLAEDGWTVAVNYLNSEEAALSLSREINCLLVKADVSDENQVSAMFKRIKSEIGSIDLLVNNAGISSYGLFTDITPEEWRKMFSVNVDGVFYCCRQAVPDMIRKKHGCIINISSMWGQVGASCESAYSASKAAVIGLTKALAKELGPSGIRVNCISPGCISTDMLGCFSQSELDALIDNTPLGTLGSPEDIAEMVCFLASEKCRFVTGQVIGANGGFVI